MTTVTPPDPPPALDAPATNGLADPEPSARSGGASTWRISAAVLALVTSLLAFAIAAGPSSAQESEADDPALDQTIEEGQEVATGPADLDLGHVDMGPRLVDGEWSLMVHDDSADPSVWRSFDDAILQVRDTALLPVPDDPNYEFLGLEPGTEVHVVPQTQAVDVVWLGWNTQDPEVLEVVDRGVTMSLLGVDGPGAVTMYLQAGNLEPPDVLWSSEVTEPQPVWVELNTHTHANWVFSEPGIYLLQVEVAAELISGETVSDVKTVRFAVGDDTSPDDARAAEPSTSAPSGAGDPSDSIADSGSESGDADGAGSGESGGAEADKGGSGGGAGAAMAVVAILAVALAAAVGVMVRRTSSARREAESRRYDALRDDASDGAEQ